MFDLKKIIFFAAFGFVLFYFQVGTDMFQN